MRRRACICIVNKSFSVRSVVGKVLFVVVEVFLPCPRPSAASSCLGDWKFSLCGEFSADFPRIFRGRAFRFVPRRARIYPRLPRGTKGFSAIHPGQTFGTFDPFLFQIVG